ncbi:MAG: TonB C-terminal domain-containing protein [Helicobacter trogontum]|uniref:TonB C-terminal domain-containing protein n=1 Tax=Helicobacter trogontum TaxID=50960 RepID=UPI00242E01D5|nr:TonB C-terminal domain-containing protein [Helicobacter trogontum]MCI5786977.1 TonB C-terminal domain-containing protein [Helicobacter trogontum]
MKEDILIHKNSPSLHVMSGFIALFVYALMLILLIGNFRFHKEQVRYGEEDAVIAEILSNESVELTGVTESPSQELQQPMTQNTNPQEQIQEILTESSAKQEIEIPKKTTPPKQALAEKPVEKPQEVKEKPKEVNLADVFANVSSQTSQDIRREEEAKRQQQLNEIRQAQQAKQAQLAQNALALEQSTKALQQATQNLQTNIKQAITTKIVLEKPKFSGNAEDKKKYDKWYAQIEQILMGEWQKSGGFHQAATSAKVRIRIDAGGKLTYLYMVSQSPYGDYNDSVITFLRKMETRLFPPPPAEGIDLSMELENTLRH